MVVWGEKNPPKLGFFFIVNFESVLFVLNFSWNLFGPNCNVLNSGNTSESKEEIGVQPHSQRRRQRGFFLFLFAEHCHCVDSCVCVIVATVVTPVLCHCSRSISAALRRHRAHQGLLPGTQWGQIRGAPGASLHISAHSQGAGEGAAFITHNWTAMCFLTICLLVHKQQRSCYQPGTDSESVMFVHQMFCSCARLRFRSFMTNLFSLTLTI